MKLRIELIYETFTHTATFTEYINGTDSNNNHQQQQQQ